MIASQHGDVISGNHVPDFLERISNMDVGLDLLKHRTQQNEVCIPVLNSFLDALMETNPHVYLELMSTIRNIGYFTSVFQLSGNMITEIKTNSEDALIYLWKALGNIANSEKLTDIGSYLAEILGKYGLPVPPGVVSKP